MKRTAENIHLTPAPARFKLKRKIGYDNEGDNVEEEGTLRGMSRLCVNNDVSMDKRM
jgi:hypothetical protein